MNKKIITTFAILTITISINTISASTQKDNKFDAGFFNTNSELFYKIGGSKRINPPVSSNNSSVNLGIGGSANLDYSCGKFDSSLAFKNLMNGFKNGVNDVKNTVVGGVQAGISALPLTTLARAMPALYDIFQEYSAEANTKIEVSAKSCEQIEAAAAKGENPYANFLAVSKVQTYKDEVISGNNDIVDVKKKAEKNNGKNGINTYGGKKAGGINQPPIRVIADSTKAGYNFILGNTDPRANTQAPSDSELYKYFKSTTEATKFATDVLGEFEINNKKPITKVGLGLHPKVKLARDKAEKEYLAGEFYKLQIGKQAYNNLQALDYRDKDTIINNILDDIAIKRTITKAFVLRKIIIAGSQDVNELAAGNKASKEQRKEAINKLDNEIKSIIFEREINQKLANDTLSKVIKMKQPRDKVIQTTKPNKFL